MEEEGPYSGLRAKLQALLVLAVSVWGLWEGKVVQGLLHNPRTDRFVHAAADMPIPYIPNPDIYPQLKPRNTSTALAVAVGASSLVVLLWGYLDLYIGAVKGQKVQYTDVRAVTHCILLGLFASGLALICALWPLHRAASLVYVAMLSYGVLFQIILLVPAAVYNPLFLFGFASFVYFWAR